MPRTFCIVFLSLQHWRSECPEPKGLTHASPTLYSSASYILCHEHLAFVHNVPFLSLGRGVFPGDQNPLRGLMLDWQLIVVWGCDPSRVTMVPPVQGISPHVPMAPSEL